MKKTGVVIIGRNEGDRLRKALERLRECGLHAVYVDSASTDESVACAQSLGFTVVTLDRSRPFSAARGRNAGFKRLMEIHPSLKYVQFIDGDCILDRQWIEKAEKFLDSNPVAGVVCGLRREIHPLRNIYHWITNVEWLGPPGQTTATGGDICARTSVFSAVGGFSEVFSCGEEADLCERITSLGHAIFRLEEIMTKHDIALAGLTPFLRRHYRGGYAVGLGALYYGQKLRHQFRKQFLKTVFWALILPLLCLFAHPLFILLYPLHVLKVALHFQREKGPQFERLGEPLPSYRALQYGLIVLGIKFFELGGMIRAFIDHRCGFNKDRSRASSRLIEYK